MIIVITGSPLSGKTTLLKKLSDRGIKVFHADSYVNEIYKAGNIGYEKIKNEFGKRFVNDISVDKRELAKYITDSNENLNKLNDLIHPLIKDYLNGKDNFVAELPIISSSSTNFEFDKIILVKASDNTIKNRFLSKNIMNPKFITKIINDWNNEEISFDYVVDTTNDIDEQDISNIIDILNGK